MRMLASNMMKLSQFCETSILMLNQANWSHWSGIAVAGKRLLLICCFASIDQPLAES